MLLYITLTGVTKYLTVKKSNVHHTNNLIVKKVLKNVYACLGPNFFKKKLHLEASNRFGVCGCTDFS